MIIVDSIKEERKMEEGNNSHKVDMMINKEVQVLELEDKKEEVELEIVTKISLILVDMSTYFFINNFI